MIYVIKITTPKENKKYYLAHSMSCNEPRSQIAVDCSVNPVSKFQYISTFVLTVHFVINQKLTNL
jgi:hypothetical protein